MGKWPLHPLVYEINTAVWLTSLSRTYGRPISLGGIPQTELERLAELRFDGVWLMGVWQRSAASRTIARAEPALLGEYRRALPDVRPDDIIGSPYAIADYTVDPLFGGDQELAALRQRLRALNLRLISSPIISPAITRGSALVQNSSCRGLRPNSRPGRTTISRLADACSPTAAIQISLPGPTRCKSTIAARPPGAR